MPARTQRVANRFPHWSKIRQDPSSLGQRLFSVFADYFDFATAEIVKVRNEGDLYKRSLGLSHLYSFPLSDADKFAHTISVGGGQIFAYHTLVTGNHATLGAITLPRVESLEAMLWNAPTRIAAGVVTAVANYLLWDSTVPTTFNAMAYAEHLTIVVSGSTEYKKRTRTKNRLHSGYTRIILTGKDVNSVAVEEYLEIPDDGVYETRHTYTELTDVKIDGLNGNIQVYLGHPPTDFIVDPYRLAIMDDLEGQLKLAMSVETPDVTVYTFLRHFTDRLKNGSSYRTGTVEVVNDDNTAWKQVLMTGASGHYTGVDIAVHPDTTRLYCISDAGTVYIYDHDITGFGPPTDSAATLESYMIVQPIKHWATLDETMKHFTWFRAPRFVIAGVSIKRIDPAAAITYLQADKTTWGAGFYEFPPNIIGPLPEESWTDFNFDSVYNQVGQWEYYMTTRTDVDTTTSYTAVLVDGLVAVAEFATGVSSPTGIWFSGGELVISNASEVARFTEHQDVYLADTIGQQILVRELYNDVEVTI